MNRDIKIALVKFMIITALVFVYIGIMYFIVSPYLVQQVYGQANQTEDMLQFLGESTPYAYGQTYDQQYSTPDQFNSPNQQYGQQYDQFSQNQFQQPYQQGYGGYGTQPYGPQQYGQPYGMQQGGYGGFGIQEIITALIAGGGSAIYTKRRTNQLQSDNQVMMSEILKGKQVDLEIARTNFQMNAEKANQINDAPSIKLENLQQDVNDFTDKTSKA